VCADTSRALLEQLRHTCRTVRVLGVYSKEDTKG
jgi:hypothetical protein